MEIPRKLASPSSAAEPSSPPRASSPTLKHQEIPKIVELNVGGHYFATSLTTLCKYPDSMLGVMFSGRMTALQYRDGRYFIDRDGEAFSVILNFLRTQRVHYGQVDKSLVHAEAEFYRIPLPIDASSIGFDGGKIQNLDLEGHSTVKSLLQYKTLYPWQDYTEKTISNNIAKIVKALTEMTIQKAGVFAATIALYQNPKKKDTISTSPINESHSDVTSLEVIVYLEVVTQPVIELWCTFFKLQGFTDLNYTKNAYPVIHWAIHLSWKSSFLNHANEKK